MKRASSVGISLLMASSAVAAQEVKKTDYLSKFEYTKYVAANRKTMIGFAYMLNPDCSSMGPIDIKITNQPQHGTIELSDEQFYSNYAQDNLRSKCNASKVPGTAVYYKSNDGFTGTDALDAVALLPGGYAQEIHYSVNVR